MKAIFGFAIALSTLALLGGLLERRFAALRGAPRTLGNVLHDLAWWPFAALFHKPLRWLAFAAVFFLPALYFGPEALKARLMSGFGPIAQLPSAPRIALTFVLGDLIGYWVHRAFHAQPWLWRVHAIHHSSRTMDWLAAARVHPLNEMIGALLRVLPLLALGFPVTELGIFAPALLLYGVLLHANLRWTFGPLRYVIASPTFHRHHHTAGARVNYAGFFPIWDLLFGTFHMPEGEQPRIFGVEDPVPSSLLGQLLYPFRRTSPRGELPTPGRSPRGG